MNTLLSEETVASIDWQNETVRRLHSVPSGWKWFSIDGHDKPEDFFVIKGAVPIGKVTKGKNKGRTKWPPESESQTYWVRMSEVKETMRIWEQDTGKCAECSGSGKTLASCGVSGTTYRDCRKCGATGLKSLGTK